MGEYLVDVPTHIKDPAAYFNRVVQHWHMTTMGQQCKAIDIDLYGWCEFNHYGYCAQPLYVIESSFVYKPTTVVRKLADRLGVPGLLIEHDDTSVTRWHIVHPEPVGRDREVDSLAAYLVMVREAHWRVMHRRR